MEEMFKKINDLLDLLKATKVKPNGPQIPKLPQVKQPSAPSMSAPKTETKLPAPPPDSKKDPRKIAQQINSGKMSTKTQKILLKFNELGQWSLEEEDLEKGSFKDIKPKAGPKLVREPKPEEKKPSDYPPDHPYNKIPDSAIKPFDPSHIDITKKPKN